MKFTTKKLFIGVSLLLLFLFGLWLIQSYQIESFENEVCNYDKTTLVLYHSTTCPYCVRMKPEWNKLKQSWNNNSSVVLKEVNMKDKNNI